jgi:hypothetical protein
MFKEALDMVRYDWDHLHRYTNMGVCPREDFRDKDIEPVLMNEPETGSREFALYMTDACDQPLLHLERAVELGHVLATYTLYTQHNGRSLDDQVKLLLVSARGGCVNAMYELMLFCDDLTINLQLPLESPLSRRSFLHSHLARHQEHFCSSWCVPYGTWRPDPNHQCFVPKAIKAQQMTWLLAAKRRRVARYVALLVCSFIVTRP